MSGARWWRSRYFQGTRHTPGYHSPAIFSPQLVQGGKCCTLQEWQMTEKVFKKITVKKFLFLNCLRTHWHILHYQRWNKNSQSQAVFLNSSLADWSAVRFPADDPQLGQTRHQKKNPLDIAPGLTLDLAVDTKSTLARIHHFTVKNILRITRKNWKLVVTILLDQKEKKEVGGKK